MPGAQELLVIALVALLVFGPNRLPELARHAGRLYVRVRTMVQRNFEQLRDVAEIEDLERELRELRAELGRADPRRAIDPRRPPPRQAHPTGRGTGGARDASAPRSTPSSEDDPGRADDARDDARPVTDPDAT